MIGLSLKPTLVVIPESKLTQMIMELIFNIKSIEGKSKEGVHLFAWRSIYEHDWNIPDWLSP